MITTLLLIRHATNDYVGRAIAGRLDGIHLNDEGHSQVRRLTERLSRVKISAVYCSPMLRAKETAEALPGSPLYIADEITEIDFGEWAGLTFDQLKNKPEWHEFNEHRGTARIPGGESFGDVQRRMVMKVEEVHKRHTGETIVFISHGDPIKTVLAHYLAMNLDRLHHLEITVASVSILRFYDDFPQVLLVNETGELPVL